MNKRSIPSDADSSEGNKRIRPNGLCSLGCQKIEVATSANNVAGPFSVGTNESKEPRHQNPTKNTSENEETQPQPTTHSSIVATSNVDNVDITSPQSYLRQRVGTNAIIPSLSVKDFFIKHTEEQIKAYDVQVIQAVRAQDMNQLKNMHKAGRQLQCANKFGESLIHMACRRGFVDVVRFLVDEAGVSVRVRDDYGRTALHDACWTSEPNEELVEYLIRQCPELLLMSDKRGNAPFEYVRREHWGQWRRFLAQKENENIFKHISVVG